MGTHIHIKKKIISAGIWEETGGRDFHGKREAFITKTRGKLEMSPAIKGSKRETTAESYKKIELSEGKRGSVRWA